MQPTERFSDRVADYVRYRPSYPADVVTLLEREMGLGRGATIADVGCGTGILAQVLLDGGFEVVGVEPNDPMRAASEELLASYERFRAVGGSAEATTLADGSVQAITAAQAFHWFDSAAARREFVRILRPGGWVALIWNDRSKDATEFLRAYEALLVKHCPDYEKVGQEHYVERVLAEFFAPAEMRAARFDNRQVFDFDGLAGRVRSSSYAPKSGPAHDEMMQEVRAAFDRFAEDGRVAFLYETCVFFGQLA